MYICYEQNEQNGEHMPHLNNTLILVSPAIWNFVFQSMTYRNSDFTAWYGIYVSHIFRYQYMRKRKSVKPHVHDKFRTCWKHAI